MTTDPASSNAEIEPRPASTGPAPPASQAGKSQAGDRLLPQPSARIPQEQAQARARLLITAALTAVAFALGVLPDAQGPSLLVVLFGLAYAVFGLAVLLYLTRVRQPRLGLAREIGVAGDITAVGLLTYLLGPVGLAAYPLYLWIIIDSGARYGERGLLRARSLALACFALACLLSGIAHAQLATFAGLMAGLFLVPHFLHVTLARLAAANAELRKQKEQAQFLARHDVLTGLPNRQLLLQRLEHAIRRAKRHDARLAVLFMDLDGFKRVNDTLGHDFGDALLTQVANCLRQTVREVDTVSRLGGDEFILLIEEYDRQRDISAVVERVFTCSRRNYSVNGTEVYLTWSCGIAVYPKDGTDGNSLIKHADIAMYRAKAQGSNRAVSYDPAMSRQVVADLHMRDELRRAIDEQQFFLLYQPLVRTDDSSVSALEALVRWDHPGRGVLTPDAFLDVALESGLIRRIDRLVLDLALADTARLRRQGAADLRLALNLAPQQLDDDGFSDLLDQLLQRHAMPPTVLQLEITERALRRDSLIAQRQLRRLRERGILIALDDFGAGPTSLTHLRKNTIDAIKLDRQLVRGLPGSAEDAALTAGILGIAQRLGLSVAAEGVETDAQLAWLAQHGCELVQGYYLGRPVRVDQLDLAGSPQAARAASGAAP